MEFPMGNSLDIEFSRKIKAGIGEGRFAPEQTSTMKGDGILDT
jgi:hypothetical protein